MGTVALREIKDVITARLSAAFPDSPEFVAFLREEIRKIGGSFEFTDIMCYTLATLFPTGGPVDAECISRLSVMGDLNAIGRVNRAFGMSRAIRNSLIFGMCLAGDIVVPDGAKTIDDLQQAPRRSVDLSNKKQEDAYTQLFYCVQAMLAGVTIDPRVDAAA